MRMANTILIIMLVTFCRNMEGHQLTTRESLHHCTYCEGPCSACQPGYFGNHCHKKCSPCDEDNSVNISATWTYNCASCGGHCKSCLSGWYGDNCTQRCINCGKDGCDKTTGICVQCKDAFHGTNCTERCPATCSQRVCHRRTSVCLDGCQKGTWGDQCHMPCSSGCLDGECFFDGTCHCKPGYQGSECYPSYTYPELSKPTTCIYHDDRYKVALFVTTSVFLCIIISVVVAWRRLVKTSRKYPGFVDEEVKLVKCDTGIGNDAPIMKTQPVIEFERSILLSVIKNVLEENQKLKQNEISVQPRIEISIQWTKQSESCLNTILDEFRSVAAQRKQLMINATEAIRNELKDISIKGKVLVALPSASELPIIEFTKEGITNMCRKQNQEPHWLTEWKKNVTTNYLITETEKSFQLDVCLETLMSGQTLGVIVGDCLDQACLQNNELLEMFAGSDKYSSCFTTDLVLLIANDRSLTAPILSQIGMVNPSQCASDFVAKLCDLVQRRAADITASVLSALMNVSEGFAVCQVFGSSLFDHSVKHLDKVRTTVEQLNGSTRLTQVHLEDHILITATRTDIA
ncbi:uncharacterized protein LOC121368970 isoform X2 [Gigantopelta aegis]|uniref:uncharacterized protein LOC121368970 isoform X2 n=1 Tax=Gigantopelta aegis TaxID=1735272 RepID=UPI001B887E30|nr:uncharacterized protein LOC121368970 isoform X2 [Gigantopelta aegis]